MSFEMVDINKVVLFVKQGDYLTVRAQSGLSDESARAIRLPISPTRPKDETFAALAFRTGEMQICQDVDVDPRYHQLAKPPTHKYKSVMAVPIFHGDQVVAALTIDSLSVDRFADYEQDQGKLFAQLFGLFI
jgi:GAF domain-containing protein